jgi:hypothetical protein
MTWAIQSGHKAITISLLLAVLAVFALVTAYSYSGASGVFPIFIGWIFLGLTSLESALQLKVILSGKAAVETGDTATEPVAGKSAMQELAGPLWLGTFLVMLYVLGLLLATPLFVFAFLRFSAHRSVWQCAVIALLALIFIYVVFTLLLNYRLYAGVVFGA